MTSSTAAPPKQTHILLLGGGITALQTALSLRTNPSTAHHQLTLIASQFPGDSAPEYTSPWAGGHWRSHVRAGDGEHENEVREWDERTYNYWMGLLRSGVLSAGENVEKEIGLGVRESRNFWGGDSAETEGHDGRGLWWRDAVSGFHVLDNKELPEGAVFGIKYQSVCINVPRYLAYMLSKVKELGVETIRAEVETGHGLEGVVAGCKEIFLSRKENAGVEEDEIVGLVNCAGLGARKFVSMAEAEKLFPIRGQTILVKGEAKAARTYTSVPGKPDAELLYVIPRPGSGTTVLGGCKQIGSWEATVDEGLQERILESVKKFGMADEVRGPGGEFEVLSSQVGFRPGRKGGPRVEAEDRKVGDVWVVHAYGHSGAGYQNSVGSAEKVVRLVDVL